jgi:6-pyruvoyl-tetrahydropterin synthase
MGIRIHFCNLTQRYLLTLTMPRLFVDQLTVIDCSILDPDRGLIGASWSVDIELQGELDNQSMVFDFAKVKRTIKQVIDQEVDHKLLVPINYTDLDISGGDQISILFDDRRQQQIVHQSPASAVCQIPTERVDKASVIEFLRAAILPSLPSNVLGLTIELHEEQAQGHYYRYSHGLKKHDGNCQRIAHGHRSQIQIWQDGTRNSSLERSLAAKWTDIYIGTLDDVVEQSADRIRFAYTTEQGYFSLELPTHRVHLMAADTTVECIAEHLLELICKQLNPEPSANQSAEPLIRVKAFEGIGKGAIASS